VYNRERCTTSMTKQKRTKIDIDSLQRVNKYRVIGELYNQGVEKWRIKGIKP